MKPMYLIRFVLLSQILLCCFNARAQYILAGHHQPGSYFVDIIPDTTLTGPYTHIPPQPPATYQIDIDGDKIYDFELYSFGLWMNGGGSQEISIRAHRTSCQIAFGFIDPCNIKIAKSLRYNDSINKALNWSNDSILYLSHNSWSVQRYSCYYNGFINDTLSNYIAVRIINTTDTTYGWIKVTNVDWSSFTVQEFASTAHASGMGGIESALKVYPVPARDFIVVETQMPDFDFILFNEFGIKLIERNLSDTKTLIDLKGLMNGIYVIKCQRGNIVCTKKIIKQ